jgi:2'-5' RNA ligase
VLGKAGVRAFVAVEVGEEVSKRIEELQRELPPVVKRVDVRNLHMTLAFLGNAGEKKIAMVKDSLASISAKPFEVKCRGVGVFPSEQMIRVVWVGAESSELRLLHSQVGYSLEKAGFKKEDYSPHLTIGRPSGKMDLSEFLRKHADEDFGSFTVDRVKLKKSTLTPKGPIYEDIFEKILE